MAKTISAKDYKAFKAWKAGQQNTSKALDIGSYWTNRGFKVVKADAGQYVASNGKKYPVVEVSNGKQTLALKATRGGSVYVAKNF